nr:putative reverse transcriptase domain-containing protein [Tanacetum cinerariifolium]
MTGITGVCVLSCVRGARSVDMRRRNAGVSYEVELADGKIVSTNTVLQGSFDVIIGMDWLARYHAVIICDERIVRIPLPDNHILDIYGERPNDCLNSLSCVKAVEKKPADIRVACEFPE